MIMITEIIKINREKPDHDALKRAGEILLAGGLVAFPTETVYGLGGNALDPTASRRIYAAKGRPSDNPLIVHIADLEDLKVVAADIPDQAMLLAQAFWPGPLTMIFPRTDKVPLETTGGLSSVAVRFPSDTIAQELIRCGGGFVAAPSANTSGRPSPTTAEHVAEDLSGRIEMILDGGPVGIGLESTIIDFTEAVPTILRPGYISPAMLESILGEVKIDPGLLKEDSHVRPKAPGMKYRHYAPKAQMVIIEGEPEAVTSYIRQQAAQDVQNGLTPGIIASEETIEGYDQGILRCAGSRRHDETIAHNLYRILREFDDEKVDTIYSESFDTPHMGHAIMNRLIKAAGHQIIKV